MFQWKPYKLDAVAFLHKEGYNPSKDESLPYIGLEHIEQQSLQISGIGSSDNVISGKFKFSSGDILFGKLRPYFRKVYRPKFNGVCSTDIWVIRNKKGFDQGYLFYFFANKSFVDIASQGSSGTKMPRADWQSLKNREFYFPSLPVQQRIAEVLSSLDDKIELNRQMNQTLEDMAKALFKHHFIDNVDENDLPFGWRIGKVGDLCSIQNGFAFKSETFKTSGECRVVKIKNIDNNYVDIIDTDFIDSADYKIIQPRFDIRSGEYLIAMTGAEVGKVGIVPSHQERILLNQRVGAMRDNIEYGASLVYTFLSMSTMQEMLLSLALGSAQPNISSSTIENIPLVVPQDDTIFKIGSHIAEYHMLIASQLSENIRLQEMRDYILPKLMNGELEPIELEQLEAIL